MIYNSEGSLSFADVYSMPVYLRHFYLRELVDQKKKEDKEIKKMNKKQPKPRTPRR